MVRLAGWSVGGLTAVVGVRVRVRGWVMGLGLEWGLAGRVGFGVRVGSGIVSVQQKQCVTLMMQLELKKGSTTG